VFQSRSPSLRQSSVKWLRSAVASKTPVETISQFVRDQHRVDSSQTRNLCEMWLRLALRLLPESRAALSGPSSSSDPQPAFVSEYPRDLLHSALFAMDDLRIDFPRGTLLDSVTSSLVALDLIAPVSDVALAASTPIGSVASSLTTPANVVGDATRSQVVLNTSASSSRVAAPARAESPLMRSPSPYVAAVAYVCLFFV
jgi:hypothetical protein